MKQKIYGTLIGNSILINGNPILLVRKQLLIIFWKGVDNLKLIIPSFVQLKPE